MILRILILSSYAYVPIALKNEYPPSESLGHLRARQRLGQTPELPRIRLLRRYYLPPDCAHLALFKTQKINPVLTISPAVLSVKLSIKITENITQKSVKDSYGFWLNTELMMSLEWCPLPGTKSPKPTVVIVVEM